MRISRALAGLLCLALLAAALSAAPPVLAAKETPVRGSCFENPFSMKLGRRATGNVQKDMESVYFQVSVPEGGQYRLTTGGGLSVEARLFRKDQSWVKTFVPDAGKDGRQIDATFSLSKKGTYFFAVEAAKAGKTGGFQITLSRAGKEAPETTPAPVAEPTATLAPTPSPAPQGNAPETSAADARDLSVPAIASVTQYHIQAVRVKWGAVAGAAGYGLYKATSASGTYALVRYVTATETTASYLAAGKQYFFRVRPYVNGAAGKEFGEYSPYQAIWILGAPVITSIAQNSLSSVRLAWNAVREADGYTLYRSTTKEGTYRAVTSFATPYVTDKSLAPGGYFYKVAAYRMNGTAKVYGPISALRSIVVRASWIPTPEPTVGSSLPPEATPAPLGGSTAYRALLVGNSDYAAPVSDLDAGADVSNMSGMLSRMNMDGKSYSVTTRQNQSAGGILSAISSAFAGADADDVSLFYYSGHGVTDTGTYAGALVGTDISYVTTAMLRNALAQVPGTVIVLLDSCGSGAAIQSRGASESATAQDAVMQALPEGSPATFNSAVLSAFSGFTARSAEFASGTKFKVIAACAIATSTWQNVYGGFFTQGLVKSSNLSGSFMNGDSDKSGVVTQSEAYSYSRAYSQSVNDGTGVIPAWDMQVQSYPSGSAFPFFQR